MWMGCAWSGRFWPRVAQPSKASGSAQASSSASSAGGAPPFVVTQAVPGRALVTVLRSRGGHLRVSYAYLLESTVSGGTRLTARLRMGGRPLLPSLLAAPVVLAAHEVGQRRQFARLRRRISALPAPHR